MPIVIKQSFPMPSSIKLTDKVLMTEIGQQAITAIRSRTRLGRDQDGQPFAAYSPGYARAKAREYGGSSRVNLTLSGDMLSTLSIVDVTATSVTIGWNRGSVR